MSDEFQYWRSALAGNKLAINADAPQSGYYRKRASKDGPWLPVAIWWREEVGDDGARVRKQVARVAGEMVDPLSVWTWVADKPVKKEDAQTAFKTGSWPGDAAPIAMGDNNPPTEPVELIPLEIEAATEWLATVKTIKTQVEADIASNRVTNLRDLKKKAEAQHKAEKEPHLEAGRAVDKKYKPKIDDADVAVKGLLAAITVFQNAERARLQKIADEKAAKERAEWERQQAEARAKAEADAAASKTPLDEILEQQPAPPPPKAETVKVRSGGASGKAVSLRTVKVATVVDYDKALMALKDHPEVRDLVQKLADRACKAGVPLAGVEYSTQQVAA